MLAALLQSMRPHQWVKNLLVFAPLMFASRAERGETDDAAAVVATVLAFAVFCLLSSGTYLLNDVVDREADRRHETKRDRPIASGRLPVGVALGTSLALVVVAAVASTTIGAASDPPFWVWPLFYFALNLSYSLWLKHQVIIDCLCIALGFQFRVHAGSGAIGVESSRWIILCTFFFAMFLAFCKRREEVLRHDDGTGATRATMREYTVPFLDQLIAPLAAASILAYALYTVDPETVHKHGPRLVFTVPFVVFGVFRYLFLVHRRGEGADPARLLFRDVPLVLGGVLWLATIALAFGIG